MYTCDSRRATCGVCHDRANTTRHLILNMGERTCERFAHDATSRSRPRSAARASPRRAPAPTRRRRCRSGCCPCSPGGGGRACSVLPWLAFGWPARGGQGVTGPGCCHGSSALRRRRPVHRCHQGKPRRGTDDRAACQPEGPRDGTRSSAPLQDHPKGRRDFSTAGPTSPLSPSTQYRPVGTRTRRDPCSRCCIVSPPIATTRLVISASPSGERRTTTSPREIR